MSGKDAERERHARAYETTVTEAGKGDRDAAERLVHDFAELANDPHVFDIAGGIPTALIQHIATCLLEWRKGDYSDAVGSFLLRRPSHGPKRRIDDRHIDALREYRRQRALKTTVPDAVEAAVVLSGLTEGQVRALVQDQSKATKKDEVLELIATEGIVATPESMTPDATRKAKRKSSR